MGEQSCQNQGGGNPTTQERLNNLCDKCPYDASQEPIFPSELQVTISASALLHKEELVPLPCCRGNH